MRKIVICGSSKFNNEILELKEKLENMQYEVINYPKKINIQNEYKQTYEKFFDDLNNADDILILNLDKNGIDGYIGYQTFAEMSFFVANNIITKNNNRKVFIYKMPSKLCGCYDEINQFLKLGYIELWKSNLK